MMMKSGRPLTLYIWNELCTWTGQSKGTGSNEIMQGWRESAQVELCQSKYNINQTTIHDIILPEETLKFK